MAGFDEGSPSSLAPITDYYTYSPGTTAAEYLPYAQVFAVEFIDRLGNQEFMYADFELEGDVSTV